MLHTVFTGKARQAYNDLSDEKSKDYETVKQTVLKVYELIPEAYRLKFRARKMSEGETHVEFVRIKNDYLITGSKQRMSAVITKSSVN